MAGKKNTLNREDVLLQAGGMGMSIDIDNDQQELPTEVIEELEKSTSLSSSLEIMKRYGANSFNLKGNNGAVCKLELMVIPHDKVESLTVVHEENARFQHWLSEIALKELSDDIKENGQLSPALGYFDEATGKIIVIDGSCRRLACHYGQCDYYIYVSDIPLDPEVSKGLSQAANLHKNESIVEKGILYKKEMAQEGIRITEYCAINNLAKETVRQAVVASDVYLEYREIFDSFPAPSFVGRPTYVSFSKKLKTLSEEEYVELKKQLPKALAYHAPTKELNKQHASRVIEVIDSIVDNEDKEEIYELGDRGNWGRVRVSTKGEIKITLTTNTQKSRRALAKLLSTGLEGDK